MAFLRHIGSADHRDCAMVRRVKPREDRQERDAEFCCVEVMNHRRSRTAIKPDCSICQRNEIPDLDFQFRLKSRFAAFAISSNRARPNRQYALQPTTTNDDGRTVDELQHVLRYADDYAQNNSRLTDGRA